VPLITGGSEEIDIPAGTQPETVFRLPKHGMPRLRRRGSGDLFVHVGVLIPTDLTEEQEEALVRYGELAEEDPTPRRRSLFRR
jgi:molecular chaperone DnaJ